MGFQWKHEGKDKYFVFNVLPFGVSVAAYIFSKVTRVLINKWRNQGIRIVMYLDHGLGGDVGYVKKKTLNIRDIFKQDLHDFLMTEKKMPMGACETRLHGLAKTGI